MNILSEYINEFFPEVSYKEFYRDVFPCGSLQKKRIDKDDYGVDQKWKYNGIIVEVTDETTIDKKTGKEKVKVLRHTLTDDLDKLDEVAARDNFCLMSPIGYIGRSRDSSNARELYAIAFDLDGIKVAEKDGKATPNGLINLFYQMFETKLLPIPTYIVSSGTGIHLYYVFDKPILMFPNVLDELEKLKKELTKMLWHDSISSLSDNIQYEPICQGFRMVGTITKTGERAKAYKTGIKNDVEYLNSFVRDEFKAKEFAYKSSLSLAQAKEKYPEWYENRIVKKKPKNTWIFNRAVYDSWLKRIKVEAQLGHRYWSIWVLAITAVKCNISQEELEQDAFDLIECMNQKDKTNEAPFTKEDVLSALEGYDSRYMVYPIDKMSYRADIPLNRNKRNGRKQSVHLKMARSNLKILNEDNGSALQGRKNKKEIVQNWRKNNPTGTKYACVKETGISKPTVIKWWNFE